MAKKTFNFIKYLLFVFLGIYLVYWSVKDVDLVYVWKIIKSVNLWMLLFVLPIMIYSHWLRAMRWRLMMNSFGENPKKINVFSAVIIGYLLNLIFPRLGEIGKCSILAKYEKISPSKLVGTIVVERILDLVSLFVVIILAFLFEYTTFYSYFYETVMSKFQIENIQEKILFASIFLLILISGLFFIVKRYPTNKISIFLTKVWKGFLEGIFSIQKMKNIKSFTFLTIMIWVMYLLGTWLSFFALGVTSDLSATVALPVLVMGSIGMIITQGGVGAYWILLQQTLMIYNIRPDDGFAYGCLVWLAQSGLFIILGLLLWMTLPLINNFKKDGQSSKARP